MTNPRFGDPPIGCRYPALPASRFVPPGDGSAAAPAGFNRQGNTLVADRCRHPALRISAAGNFSA
jgi:hypothetical protein